MKIPFIHVTVQQKRSQATAFIPTGVLSKGIAKMLMLAGLQEVTSSPLDDGRQYSEMIQKYKSRFLSPNKIKSSKGASRLFLHAASVASEPSFIGSFIQWSSQKH